MSCSACRHQLVHDASRGIAVCSNCGARYDEDVLFEAMMDDGPSDGFAASVAAAAAGGGARVPRPMSALTELADGLDRPPARRHSECCDATPSTRAALVVALPSSDSAT